MNLAEEAFRELYPDYEEHRAIRISYSAKFRKLNANVKYTPHYIHFSLSRDWTEFSDGLKKGLIQSLMIRVFKGREYVPTLELDLYQKFMKNVGRYAKVEETDPLLDESFKRVNEEYFDGLMERPNLVWGGESFRKLGHYEFAANRVLISSILREDEGLLDYVMYHELLHKKHSHRRTKTGRMVHHSREFKRDEARFKLDGAEKKLNEFLRRKKAKKWFSWW